MVMPIINDMQNKAALFSIIRMIAIVFLLVIINILAYSHFKHCSFWQGWGFKTSFRTRLASVVIGVFFLKLEMGIKDAASQSLGWVAVLCSGAS